MNAVLVLALILIFSSCGTCFAVPVKWAPDSEIRGGSVAAETTTPDAAVQVAARGGTPAGNPDPNVQAAAPDPAFPKIPTAPVHMFIRQGPESRFELFFTDVRYDHDLVDFEFYKGWCLLKDKPIRRNAIHTVRLYNCYDPNLPGEFKNIGWNQINYIINHKKGSKEAIQQAIWHFTESKQTGTLKPEAYELINEANLKAKDYKPAEGELIAVICQPDAPKQPVFLEYKIPASAAVAVASDIFLPVIPTEGAMFVPFWVPLIPLIPLVPVVPFTPDHPDEPKPPPEYPPVPEPASWLLLASGMVGILVSRVAGKRGFGRRSRGVAGTLSDCPG